ncbi:BCL2/adenovirus E1B 19 kDa protein-interacting protein 3-like [Oppia nitens]|uniref:BCL2/adenovirus E1B 19 kDa protein-interacting protein 3-like n=1 Tax=Oppia nitens TaxID=1686743 RepID=UPI0023DC072F|nr:BCL2/adenovirus E1B 19 kDa protein-interacting protein 3-like [Oppia nitens]
MTSTPRSFTQESLNESWVEVNSCQQLTSPVHLIGRTTGLNTFQSLERLLWEAQKESNESSLTGSARNSHSISPKSAHSPVFAIESLSPNDSILQKVENFGRSRQLSTDWIWDWSTRDQLPKEWGFNEIQPLRKSRMSLRQWAIRRGIFSKEVLSILLLTNILSLILGAGIGYTILVRRTI